MTQRYCEKADEIEWVYKNGDKGAEYFSIIYYDGMLNQCLFYPDYIVKMKDESVWIIETKGGESDSGADENIDDEPKLFLNNTEYTEEMTDNWKRIENFF